MTYITQYTSDTLRAHNMESPMHHHHHVPLTSQTTPTTPAPILAAVPQLTLSSHAATPTSPLNSPSSPLTTPTYKPIYPGGQYPVTPVAAPTLPRGRGLFTQRPAHSHPTQLEHNMVDDCDASVSDAGKTTSSRDRFVNTSF